MIARTPTIQTSGSSFLGPDGEPLLLRGVCLGGWLNMENFISGYSANETLMRREVRRAIGDDRAERFFERLLDGNTYATEFDIFEEPFENAVYTLHDYVDAGLGRSPHYSREEAEEKFLKRSAYARATGTPILVGEFGPIYTGNEAEDARLRGILADQLDLYRRHSASWALWMYKDIGRQGLVSVRPETPYRRRFDDFVAKKNRLAADQWGSDGIGVAGVTQPVQDLIAREFPGFDPYPWGRFDWVRTLLLNITVAQPLAHEYASRFRGLDDSELDALADSFAFESCALREPLLAELQRGLATEMAR